MRRKAAGTAGGALVIGLAITAVVWGRDGVEVASWLAGVASLFVAVVTVLLTTPAGDSAAATVRHLRFRADARGDAQVFQAGGDITNAGHRPPKR